MRVLIIGIGSIALKHINAIYKFDSKIEIVALRSNINSKPIKGVKDIFSYDEIKGKIDFIIISNPTSLHEQTILDTLHFGCPLFIVNLSLVA